MEFIEVTAKTLDDAITEASIQLGTTSDNIQYEVIDKGSSGFLGLGSKEAKIKVWLKSTPVEEVKDFLSKVFKAMNLDVEILVDTDENYSYLDVDLRGEDMGVLIGKRGQTLDSLQSLASLVVNKNAENFIRVKLDTENYRKRRKDTLENLAKNIAFKVKKTRKVVSLEPMNPYERRIIHSALQNDKFVTTHSEGEEPFRHVVVTLKKNNREYNR
ncbi:MAG: protein jag [Lachnospiraceae bacterium]|jgi:spoIIIJ-associated protein|nr:protein jag [Lachnospiraceae bacterium]